MQTAQKARDVTIREALVQGIRVLKEAGVESPQLDCAVLLASALGVTKDRVYVEAGQEIDPARLLLFQAMLERRARREPVQYITGAREFMGLDFEVGPGVLVPRPETETLVEVVKDLIGRDPRAEPEYLLADIGTGSGAIAVAIALATSTASWGGAASPASWGGATSPAALPGAHACSSDKSGRPHRAVMILATDTSFEALEVAERNAARHGVEGVITFLQGDMWQPLDAAGLAGRLDGVVSNPPYIATQEMEILQPEVRMFEPREALDGGEDGLSLHRILASGAPKFLKPGGFLALEVGAGQAAPVRTLLESAGIRDCRFVEDLRGIARVVYGFRA